MSTNSKNSSSALPSLSLSLPSSGKPVDKSPGLLAQGDLPTGFSPIFKNPYDPHRRVSISFHGVGRTKQSFRDDCDINNIMARYMKTGVLDHVRAEVAQYGDVSGADFQGALDLVAGAKSMFHSLPSNIRTEFENNPAKFFEFMENPANAQRAREMGLLAPEAPSSTPPSGIVRQSEPASATQSVEASGKPGEAPAAPKAA